MEQKFRDLVVSTTINEGKFGEAEKLKDVYKVFCPLLAELADGYPGSRREAESFIENIVKYAAHLNIKDIEHNKEDMIENGYEEEKLEELIDWYQDIIDTIKVSI